jgi:hypothetical protein
VAVCAGNSDDHCCYVAGGVCHFLEENTVPGRRWACGLYRRLGSWAAMVADPGWQEHVKPTIEGLGMETCGDWPRSGEVCLSCGVTG